jgi:hypothetical protein
MRIVAIAVAVLALLGCGDDEEATVPEPPQQQECGPGEIELPNGNCLGVGVPPEGCAPGFEFDDFGCRAIVPEAPCGPGTMAVLGDTVCREVAPCGSGKWGDIPVEANTQHVDPSYSGNSNGSAAQPWSTIAEALAAAESGAIVALAAGQYAEAVTIFGKAVRLWGKCPAEVSIRGEAIDIAAVYLSAGSHGTELHDLALTGSGAGAAVFGSQGVLFERVWIHDTGDRGISLQATSGPVVATVRGSLVEATELVGIHVSGATADIEGTHVRDIRNAPSALLGRGINAQSGATVSVSGSVLERTESAAIFASASQLSVDASYVVDTRADTGLGIFGRGIAIQPEPGFADMPASITKSTIESATEMAININRSGGAPVVHVSETTVSNVRPRPSDLVGGVALGLVGGELELRESMFDGGLSISLVVLDAHARVDSVLIRNTLEQQSNQSYGDGIAVLTRAAPASIELAASYVASSVRAGLSVFGSRGSVSDTVFVCNSFDIDVESFMGEDGAVDDAGGNNCGCDELAECRAVTSGIEPPQPPDAGI